METSCQTTDRPSTSWGTWWNGTTWVKAIKQIEKEHGTVKVLWIC